MSVNTIKVIKNSVCLMKKIISIVCILFLSFPAAGESENIYSEEFVSKYKDIPVQIEAANLGLRTGLSVYFINRQESVLQLPVLVELKVPFSLKHINTKWLISAGGGWMWKLEKVPEEQHPWCARNSFFCRDDRKLEWTTRASMFYLSLQPGLMHNFGSLVVALRAGVFIDMERELGALANVSISTSDWWDIGLQTLYNSYNDVFYFGIALRIQPSLKRWKIKNPYKN